MRVGGTSPKLQMGGGEPQLGSLRALLPLAAALYMHVRTRHACLTLLSQQHLFGIGSVWCPSLCIHTHVTGLPFVLGALLGRACAACAVRGLCINAYVTKSRFTQRKQLLDACCVLVGDML